MFFGCLHQQRINSLFLVFFFVCVVVVAVYLTRVCGKLNILDSSRPALLPSSQPTSQLLITIKSVERGMATTRKQHEHLSMNDKSTSRPDVCTVMNDQGF